MVSFLKHMYRATTTLDDEAKKVTDFIRQGCNGLPGGGKVLDIGCGYGRYLRTLNRLGVDATGVDVNPEIVLANRAAGLQCLTLEELEKSTVRYDVLCMSHIIEHFSPRPLLDFMDHHLDRLTPCGHLVLATPLQSTAFYDDFDHVRPYHPQGLMMVFGEGVAQVQYYARNRLRLVDVWFRRGPFRVQHSRAILTRAPSRFVTLLVNLSLALAFRATFGLVGRVDGWVGLFQKVERQCPN